MKHSTQDDLFSKYQSTRSLIALVLFAVLVVVLSFGLFQRAFADPTAAEKQAEAERVLANLNSMQETLDSLSDEYGEALAAQEEAEKNRDAAQARLAEINGKIDDVQSRLSAHARDMYRTGSVSYLDALLNVNTFEEFVTSWDILNRVNENAADLVETSKDLAEEEEEQAAVFSEQATIASAKAEEAAQAAAQAESTILEMQATYDSLSAEAAELLEKERKAREAEEAAQAAAVMAEAKAAAEREAAAARAAAERSASAEASSSSSGSVGSTSAAGASSASNGEPEPDAAGSSADDTALPVSNDAGVSSSDTSGSASNGVESNEAGASDLAEEGGSSSSDPAENPAPDAVDSDDTSSDAANSDADASSNEAEEPTLSDEVFDDSGEVTEPTEAEAPEEEVSGYDDSESYDGGSDTVSRAYSCLGAPYVWGGVGPGGYDCSGLVSYCLSGSHTRLGTTYTFMGWPRVSNPQPGDIAVNSGHTGVYIGDGQMIHAATYGVGVIVGPVQSGMIFVRYPG